MHYLILFIPNEKSIEQLKTLTAIKVSALKEYVIFPIEPKIIDGIIRYNFAVLKNNIQQLENAMDLKRDCKFYKDFADQESLSVLKKDTLFIVSDRSIDTTISVFKTNYPYKCVFITSKVLEAKVKTISEPFYYMHFAFSDEYYQNQISVVNAYSGLEIYHNKLMSTELLISERILKELVVEIDN